MKTLLLTATHAGALAVGFALGIYVLPLLTQPPAPDVDALAPQLGEPRYTATFAREREDSDALHWGDGELRLYQRAISFAGELAPGPDYRLYLVPEYVETEADFLRLKSRSLEVGPVRNFTQFLFADVERDAIERFTAAVVWCEAFSQFITSGRYRDP